MTPSGDRPPPVNLLALPSLPVCYLAIMAAVILGALLSTALPGSPLTRLGPALIGLFCLLVLRDFLIQPEREVRARRLVRPSGETYTVLRQQIAAHALRAGLPSAPGLWMAPEASALFVFGTFRHRYVAISADLADRLEADFQSLLSDRCRRAEAALLHEMQHFSQQDVVVVGLARSLLRVGAVFCLLGLILLAGMASLALAYPIAPLLDPGFAERIGQLQPELGAIWPALVSSGVSDAVAVARPPELGLALLFLLNAFLPLAVTVAGLAALVWPRLLRMRELYADAGVAQRLGRQALLDALICYGNPTRPTRSGIGWRERLRREPLLRLVTSTVHRASRRWARLHPSLHERHRCLERPAAALGAPAENGHWAGMLCVLLDTLLVGALTTVYAARIPGVIPVVLGTLAASFALLPQAIEGRGNIGLAARSAARVVGTLLVWRMGWHLLNLILLWLGALLAPEVTGQALSGFVHSIAGVLVHVPEGDVTPDSLLPLAAESTMFWLYLTALLTLALSGAIALEWHLRRAALTWYAVPGGARTLKRLSAGITAWTLILVAGLGLPLVALVAPISPADGFSTLGWTVLAVEALLGIAGLALFWSGHRRYAGRCPTCKAEVPGAFSLGRTACPSCGRVMWPELIANY